MIRTDEHPDVGDYKQGSAAKTVDHECARHGRDEIPDLQAAVNGRLGIGCCISDTCMR